MLRQGRILLIVIALFIFESCLYAQESNENFDETEFSKDFFGEFDSLSTEVNNGELTEPPEDIEPEKSSATKGICMGINFGGQLFNGDIEWTRAGWSEAFELFLNLPLKQRFFITPALGYGSLSDGTFHLDNNNFFTEMITFDFRLGINLFNIGTKANNYLYLGAGMISYKLTEFKYANSVSPVLEENKTATSIFIGAGFEYQVQPNLGLIIQSDYRFTNSDDLEGLNSQQPDGYANIRLGMTYYFKSKQNNQDLKVIADFESVPFDVIEDDTMAVDNEMSFFEEGLSDAEESENSNNQVDEYMKLKSKLSELSDLVHQKEAEIYELKSQLDYKNKKLEELKRGMQFSSEQTQYIETDVSDFANSYEEGLRQFYSRNYDQSIYIFSQLLEVQPNHRLASNCQYWIGECYFGLQNYLNALEAFKNVFSFEASTKIDDSLIMMARCLMFQGESQSAKEMLEQLLDEFPDSEYIAAAEKYLGQL